MATTTDRTAAGAVGPERIPPLENGDRLTRPEFERRYDAMPNLKKAELIEGVVYVPSPISTNHSGPHFDLNAWLGLYRASTPGVLGYDNTSLRLDIENEPQPDACLLVLPTHGGQARIDEENYVVGAPELVVEIAATSASYDLHAKLQVYQRHGAQEYVVWRVFDQAIDWFVLRAGRYELLLPGEDGIHRSEILPGLWLDTAALMRGDLATVLKTLQQGLASPEHGEFVARLVQAASG
jgi:Uma2 family endonuclease